MALIFGGAGISMYELYWKPLQLDEADRKMALNMPPPTPPPDYSVPIYQKAAQLATSGKTAEARQALQEFIVSYPQSTVLPQARRDLGDINASMVLSSTDKAGKTVYEVKHGDSLVKIASKFKTNPDLISQVNDLGNVNLSIGDQLVIPQVDISIVIDRKAHTVVLLNHNEFFKEYQTLAMKTPAIKPGSPQSKAKINDKIALSGPERVAFGNRKYEESDRMLMTSTPGLTIRGLPWVAEGATPPPMPSGIVLSQSDMQEVFMLVSKGTPVVVQ